jgi:hypothetical protein
MWLMIKFTLINLFGGKIDQLILLSKVVDLHSAEMDKHTESSIKMDKCLASGICCIVKCSVRNRVCWMGSSYVNHNLHLETIGERLLSSLRFEGRSE